MTTRTVPTGGSSSSSSSSLFTWDSRISDLPLRPSTRSLLQAQGFTGTCREISQSVARGGMTTLAAELGGISPAVAARIHREIQQLVQPTSSSSTSSLQHPSQPTALSSSSSSSSFLLGRCIVTFSRAVDELLGGGIRLGEVTEVAGPPGSGKTQWAMQLAVNAKLPTGLGGVQGDTLYMDAEGSFAPSRCATMAHELVQHITRAHRQRLEQQQRNQQQPSQSLTMTRQYRSIPAWFTAETILKSIHVHRVYDLGAQTALLYQLEQRLQEAAAQAESSESFPIRLVVVDSMAFHYRAAAPPTNNKQSVDYATRTRHLSNLVQRLQQLAVTYQVAIVTINQMTTKQVPNTTSSSISSSSSTFGSKNQLVPALGMAWAHAVTTRILLEKQPPSHLSSSLASPASSKLLYACHLTKSTCRASGTAVFQICHEGIRGKDFVSRPPPPVQQQQHPPDEHAPWSTTRSNHPRAAQDNDTNAPKRIRTN